jgi:hypothetical protein
MQLNRHTHIVENIVFLDGLTGTGKTMLGPIISSLDRVEIGRLEHAYEYFCVLDDLQKIEADAAEFMIRMYADLAIYNSLIGRETNFRPSDLSGVFSNPNPLEYLKRLFYQDGDPALDRLDKSKPILHIISHQALGVMDLAFRAFGSRLNVVEMVRHPLYLLEHWYSYIDRHGSDRRDFTIWLDHGGQSLPWFAHGWEDKYAESSSMDRIIYSIKHLVNKKEALFKRLGPGCENQVLEIPFEQFVLEPWPYLESICNLLGTQTTETTKKILRKQKVPRTLVAAGPDKGIYRRYGWKRPDKHATEKGELEKKWAYAREHASEEGLATLEVLCKAYEEKYGTWY